MLSRRAACKSPAFGVCCGQNISLRLMNLLRHAFAFVLGAAVASWATWRLAEAPGAAVSPVVRSVIPPAPPPTLDAGRDAELARVEAEKRELDVELASTREKLAESEAALAEARENLAVLRRPMEMDLISSTLRANLKSGEVVVTGGYRLPDGTRAYAFVHPVVGQADGRDVVTIGGEIRAVDEATGAAVGLDNLATNADNTMQHGEVWVEDERRVIYEALDHVSAPAAISLPRMTVVPGRTSTIAVGDMSLTVTPTLGADRENLDFEVRLERAKVVEPEPVPIVRIVDDETETVDFPR